MFKKPDPSTCIIVEDPLQTEAGVNPVIFSAVNLTEKACKTKTTNRKNMLLTYMV